MIGEKTRKLVYAALFAALTCVMTMIVKIPVPATGGYVNLGDCVVLLAGWVLGPMYGGAAAGLGSMLADLVSGYPLYDQSMHGGLRLGSIPGGSRRKAGAGRPHRRRPGGGGGDGGGLLRL